ncbi:MAG: molybdopterin-guanine dinucleotide biosynthesis protein B [Dysosmobacter sp.]|uniref:molybdopterin-guanine dinucleotide biosynthesis protein B n=1 Tax=Dysosmobacter sp. TaxID=2591382 RepID=UPI00283C37A3|nr:molybdopterin-guanine dinucleotide biosynthesis protein B [Dysosmobacter sp.]MDR3983221.1 molybdopterin-guanine dinucleotide biosynthesis protein B [Dysosmobacter sp.]
MAIPVISFAAYSGSGKTAYLTSLIPCLKDLGLRIAVIKHDGHDFQMDRPGTDTHRLAAAGADTVAIVSQKKFALIQHSPPFIEDIAARIQDVDLILTEGFKHGPFPKIALYRQASGQPLAVPADACLAIVSDVPLDVPCPVFPLDDPKPLAVFLREQLMQKKGD